MSRTILIQPFAGTMRQCTGRWAPPQSWSRETIDRFFCFVATKHYPVHKVFDSAPIIMSRIPAEFLQELAAARLQAYSWLKMG